jgi:phosphatidylglycerophosphate synthase
MRKIPKSAENPIDNFCVDISEVLCPLFKRCGFTPNGITTLSLVFGLISIYFLWKYNMFLFSVTYFISYLFDCMDGHYARKYNMVSKGGDIYDHVKDIVVHIILFSVLFYRYPVKANTRYIIMAVMAVFTILMTVHLGCQEKIYDTEESDTLSFSRKLCLGNAEDTIKFTRYFGCGTFALVIIALVIYMNKIRLNGPVGA